MGNTSCGTNLLAREQDLHHFCITDPSVVSVCSVNYRARHPDAIVGSADHTPPGLSLGDGRIYTTVGYRTVVGAISVS